MIDIGILVTIAIFVLTLIGTLLTMIYRSHQEQIKQIQIKLDIYETKLAAEAVARVNQYDGSFARVYTRIEDVEQELHKLAISTQQQIGDLNTTVAGFGGTYVPRSEINQLRDEIHSLDLHSRGRKL